MNKYFNDIKVGDRIWTFELGEKQVNKVKDDFFVIETSGYNWVYDKNGVLLYVSDNLNVSSCYSERSQTAFWSKPMFELPISLEQELKKLVVKKFIPDEDNATIYISWNNNTIHYTIDNDLEIMGAIYFYREEVEKLIDICKKNRVGALQFNKAFNKVFNKSEVRINGN